MPSGVTQLPIQVCRQARACSCTGFVEGHTFEGSPIACAAAIAVLQEVIERDLCANARVQGARLRAAFEKMAAKHGIIGDIRGKGLFLAMEFAQDPATKKRFPDSAAFGVSA